jgi:hypothetical protein
MTADNPSTWSYRDGTGVLKSGNNTTDAAGNTTTQYSIRTNGGPVEEGNRFPTEDTNSAASLAQAELSATALGTPADAAWGGSGSSSVVAALKAIWTELTGTVKTQLQAGTNAIGSVSVSNGSLGSDASSSTNRASLPSAVGATVGTSTYGGSGPFAAYTLVASVAASTTRANIDIENLSGAQIVVVRDDGTAATGSAPVNASWFLLAGGSGSPSQGGAWSSKTFRGRIQIWAASVPTYPPTVMVD